MNQIDDEHAKIGPDGKTKLVNLRHFSEDSWTVYIGRENKNKGLEKSIFANPFKISDHGREDSIRRYKQWLNIKLNTEEFRKELKDLQGENLACWCLPKACNGEVLLKWINRLNKE